LKITEKIRTARDLCLKWGTELKSDPLISSQLRKLSERTEASRLASLQSGVADACRRCDENEGGSCCGAGIEDRYTPELLLINLIVGTELPESRYSEDSCHFLHNRGCILPVRDILCINYLCSKLQRDIPHGNLLSLQDATGREMEAVFVLHNTIRNFIKKLTA
jgi:hypothetical protein